jgi:cytochrome c-type biogenesis protein CcmH/NrfG
MTEFLFQAHSGLRWLVVLITVVALAWLIIGLVSKRPYDKNTHRVMVTFSSLIGVQWLLGIILFLVLGLDVGFRWEHAVTMTLALIAAHLYMPFKRREDQRRYIAGIVVILVTLALVYVGVARLPQGWMG